MSRIDAAGVSEALALVRDRLDAAGGHDVSILPVTKAFDRSAIDAARAAGCTAIGENYAQELLSKKEACVGLDVHFIGQLQTNKVRQLAGLVTMYESVDRARLAREIAKRQPGARVLIQVDTAGQDGKGGCPITDLDALVDVIGALDLDLRGLMTVGPTGAGAEAARPGFRAVRAAVDRLGLEVCSMGMTADLEVAVDEGSTQVRVGTAIFGSRSVPTQRDQAR